MFAKDAVECNICSRWVFCALFLTALLVAPGMRAQSNIVLGRASVELTGPWKFQPGDNPAWSGAEFDDSSWGTMDLTPPTGSLNPFYGSSGFVPGWTARGFAGYSGFAWYRLRVNVEDHAEDGLAIKMPEDVDDAYQLYANGQLVGEFGSFHGEKVSNYATQPRAFRLPASLKSGRITLAVRMWMAPDSVLIGPAAGGMHGPPMLGLSPVVLAMSRLDWELVHKSEFSLLPEAGILLLAVAVGFWLYALDRSEPAYLWLAVTCIVVLLFIAESFIESQTTWLPSAWTFFLHDVILVPAGFALWILFWVCWFRLDETVVLRRVVVGLVILEACGAALQREPLYGHLVHADAVAWIGPVAMAIKLMLGAALIWVAVRGILKDRTEGLLALPAVVLLDIAQYQGELQLFHAPIYFFPFGFTVSISQVATGISLLIITVLLLRRFVHGQRMREQWRLEVEQARQVQQVLIPEKTVSVPGFALQSEYIPAQEVGGDFFQLVPGSDGSLLAVIGDVSGKGLRAAMLVSLIVGAVRSFTAYTRDPAEILRGLNNRLHGHMGGQFATCVALHISPDGQTAVANAGHIPPYLNGSELPLTGSIPLGILENAPVEEASLILGPGDSLVLLTDGIIEARNPRQELFGFPRLAKLLGERSSAVEIAAAAQRFGQEDDITVLRIERSSKTEKPAAARSGEYKPGTGEIAAVL